MTGKLDKKFFELAAAMIRTFGKSVTYTVVGKPVYDPAVGKAVAPEVSRDVAVSILDSHAEGFSVECDHQVLVARAEVDIPTMRDRLTIDGETFTVVEKKPIYSGEKIAATRLFVKRA